MVKVTIKVVVDEDRQLNIVVPEGIPVGTVLVTFTPLREESDVDVDELIQLPPGSPSID